MLCNLGHHGVEPVRSQTDVVQALPRRAAEQHDGVAVLPGAAQARGAALDHRFQSGVGIEADALID